MSNAKMSLPFKNCFVVYEKLGVSSKPVLSYSEIEGTIISFWQTWLKYRCTWAAVQFGELALSCQVSAVLATFLLPAAYLTLTTLHSPPMSFFWDQTQAQCSIMTWQYKKDKISKWSNVLLAWHSLKCWYIQAAGVPRLPSYPMAVLGKGACPKLQSITFCKIFVASWPLFCLYPSGY